MVSSFAVVLPLLTASQTQPLRFANRLAVQEQLKAREAADEARRKAKHAGMLQQKEREKEQKRLEKIREYKEKKVRFSSGRAEGGARGDF